MHKLDVFDFDGTLFRTPENTHQNRRKYEKDKGIPWVIDKKLAAKLTRKLGRHVGMRRGWWGRKETLEPPLVPDPAPPEMFISKPCEALHKSKADPDILTLLMTGRYTKLASHVLRICGDGGLIEVDIANDEYHSVDPNITCMFLGASGPDPQGNKPGETLPWKVWIMEQYLRLYDIEEVEIWEDRPEHVEAFRKLPWKQRVVVNHVKEAQGV